MSLFCTVSDILPLARELTTYVTTNDIEKYAAVEVVAQAIVVISFVGDICCIFRDTGSGR